MPWFGKEEIQIELNTKFETLRCSKLQELIVFGFDNRSFVQIETVAYFSLKTEAACLKNIGTLGFKRVQSNQHIFSSQNRNSCKHQRSGDLLDRASKIPTHPEIKPKSFDSVHHTIIAAEQSSFQSASQATLETILGLHLFGFEVALELGVVHGQYVVLP